jgi:hypothetical protein
MSLTPQDLTALSQAIQSAITAGFNNVILPNMNPPGPPPPPQATLPLQPSVPQPAPTVPTVNQSVISESSALIGADRTIASYALNIGSSLLEAANIIFEESNRYQESWYVKQYRSLIKDLGPEIRKITEQEFAAGDFSKIFNEGEKSAARSLRNMADYASELVQYDGLALDEISVARKEIISSFGDTNANLLNQSTAVMEKESIRFSNAMKISAEDTADLIGVTFAETGEATEKILSEITNQAYAVGNATGVPLKVMAKGIKDIKIDMDTFTDMTVAGAAKMVASLSQLGMSISTFKNLMQPFRDFDTAATKMGDLSALFGVQMDAMEMMYLANEDEEQFLHKMREQLLDQGLDVESMSKTRQRALAEQLGMDVKTMKMFMNTGQIFSDQNELEMAAQEASVKSHSDAMNILNESMVKVSRSSEEMLAIIQNLQGLFSAPSVSKFSESIGAAQGSLIETSTSIEGLGGKIIKTQQTLSSLSSTVSSELSNVLQKVIPDISNFSNSAIEETSRGVVGMFDTLKQLTGIGQTTHDALETAGAVPSSWPRMFYGLAESFGDPSVPGGSEQRELYIASVSSWGEIFVNSIIEAIEKIDKATNFENIVKKFDDASSEIKLISSDINASISSIRDPNLKISNDNRLSVEANTLDKEYLKLISAIESLESNISKKSEDVNVKIDIDSLKTDLIKTIKEGFSESEYSFNLSLDKERIATIISKTNVGGRQFQMRTI